jgi:hypothetical protein
MWMMGARRGLSAALPRPVRPTTDKQRPNSGQTAVNSDRNSGQNTALKQRSKSSQGGGTRRSGFAAVKNGEKAGTNVQTAAEQRQAEPRRRPSSLTGARRQRRQAADRAGVRAALRALSTEVTDSKRSARAREAHPPSHRSLIPSLPPPRSLSPG